MFIKIIKIASVLTCLSVPAQADQFSNNNTSHGFSLPNAPMPNGFDEVRAADGTTCRSSMSGNGAYLDVGGIGGESSNGTVYGRLVIPLGKKPGRVDCRSLYQLEIDRLKHELRMVKSGMGAGGGQGKSGDWQKEGWNNN